MNRQWMRQQLETFEKITAELVKILSPALRLDYSIRPNTGTWAVMLDGGDAGLVDAKTFLALDGRRAQLYRAEPTIRQILSALDPKLAAEFDLNELGKSFKFRDQIQRALGILNDMDAWAANLAPDAPMLRADQFHPWIWGAAHTFWESQHYRAAVDAAANSINAHTQTKIGRRDIFDADLMNQVFTDKPKQGQAYLQLPGDLTDQTIRSRNRALRPFAEGCFAGIRNPAAHEHGADWEEQQALESLAALSVLARWIDECIVHHA